MEKIGIGVVGGSGLYEMEALKNIEEVSIDTPFGKPSDNYIIGELEGRKVAFLARHGRGHKINPTNLPTRANIYGFKKLGVQTLIAASACGSMKEEYKPTDIVVIDQFIDRTRHRPDTFFDKGLVAHVSLADPICGELAKILYENSVEMGATAHHGGTYLNMEGPQFSTRAESHLYRSWNVDVIGMTLLTEARLAREAEMCYAALAMVTDYDCWHEEEEDVSTSIIVETLRKNAAMAQKIIQNAIVKIGTEDISDCACHHALATAIFTHKDLIPKEIKKKLNLLISKYMD